MASKTWCPRCSKPNLYEIEKPRICGFCGQDMTTAFKTAPLNEPRPPTMTTARENQYVESQPAPAPLRRPKPLYGSYEDLEPQNRNQDDDTDEHYSRSQMKARASQFAQAFAGAFNFSVEPGTTVKAGEFLAPVQAAAEKGASAPKKRVRKAK